MPWLFSHLPAMLIRWPQRRTAAPIWLTAPQQPVTVTLAASDVSQISSHVTSQLAATVGADVSDALSAARAAHSHAVVIQSLASDTLSQAERTYSAAVLTQSRASDAHSQAIRTYSAIAAGVTLTASHLGTVADKILNRNLSGATDGVRPVKEALYALRNKVTTDITTSLIKVYEPNDGIVSWSGVVFNGRGSQSYRFG